MRRYNKSARGQKAFLNGVFAVAKIANNAYKAQQRENKRRKRAVQRYVAKCEREAAAAERRRVREAERLAREQARIARENEKLQKKLQFEAEVQSIIEENELWTSSHKEVETIVSENDLIKAIREAEAERSNINTSGLFDEPIPAKVSYMQQAENESNSKSRTITLERDLQSKQIALNQMVFDNPEPTEDSVYAELEIEAKNTIKAFWPWKKKRLRSEYIQERLSDRLRDEHNSWAAAKYDYDSKVSSLSNEINELDKKFKTEKAKQDAFIESRTEELYNHDLSEWKTKREKFYADYIANLQSLLRGEQSVVEETIPEVLSDNDLPMEYFVEASYDESTGVARLDVDLPEIEDIPQQKIVLTSTGKQSIRSKAQKDLNEDYAQCICGLAILLAEDIFNVSPKIKDVVISGFTQREDSKTHLVTDQYVYMIDFDRETFGKIDYNKFSAIQIFSFFHHHINATKTLVLKEIDIDTACDKVQQYVPVNYDEFVS